MEYLSLEELLHKLEQIVNKWHLGTRQGNDGNQGNTLEGLLGIQENNLSIPDYGEYELKTQKAESGSLITLFHKEPTPPKSVPKLLLSVGWPHREAGKRHPETEMSFRMTTPSNSFTNRGFKIDIDDEKICFIFDPSKVVKNDIDRTSNFKSLGDWLNDVEHNRSIHHSDLFPIYYDRSDFEKKCKQKLDKTLFVTCKTKKKEGKKWFYYDEAYILNGFNSEKLKALFQEGVVFIDFDARTGHNHGTKVRIKKDRLPDLFDFSKKVA